MHANSHKWLPVAMNILGGFILAFGLYNIHAISSVTEGGVLGLTLLLQHWFHISPAISGFIMNAACYIIGWRTLGKGFIAYSVIAGFAFSLFYALLEQFPPLMPQLAQMPLTAAVAGGLFVGVGVGLCVRFGGAPTGDDALAMSVSKVWHFPIQRVYLISDLFVLGLSVSYIPVQRLVYSLLTVVLSGQLIGLIQRIQPIGKKTSKT